MAAKAETSSAAQEKWYVKTLDGVFDEMTSFEWLEQSYRKARKQKRYRPEVLKFSSDLDVNLLDIQEQLREERFHFGPYRKHWVYVPKKRIVMALPFDSRVVQWAIYLVLKPFYQGLMIEDSYACLDDKGSLAAAQRLQYWLRQIEHKPGNWYCLKLDISKYFYRIDHAVLLDILNQRVRDDRLMRLIENIVNCDGERFGLPRFMGPEDVEADEWLGDVGMPIGNLTSQLFANIYLNELDQFCKHQLHIGKYDRYMDDTIALAPDKATAHSWLSEIDSFLYERLHLDLNRKTSIRPASQNIEFVGYILNAHSLRLRKPTVRRMKSAYHGICAKYFSGQMNEPEFQRRVAAYEGMMKHTDNTGLRYQMNQIYIHEREKAEMSNLQIIQALSEIVEKQNLIIRQQADALAQLGAICAEEQIGEVNGLVSQYLGRLEN